MRTRKIIFSMLIFIMVSFGVQAQGIMPEGEKLLVWIGAGDSPANHDLNNAGQLVLMDEQTIEPILNIPAQTTRVLPCGDEASSPDNQFFAFYVGGDEGNLYLMDGTNAPTMVNDVHAFSCVGNGTFQFSDDGQQFGYLDASGQVNDSFPVTGWLRVVDAATLQVLQNFEEVTAFDMRNGSLAFISLFTNEENEAVEAAVFLSDGTSNREIATLLSSENCQYTSASIAIVSEAQLVVVMGHRCQNETTNWRFHTVNIESRSATLAMTDSQPGGFFSGSRTNNLYVSPNGSHTYFTVPDGLSNRTVALAAVDMNSMNVNVVVPNWAWMPRFTGNPDPHALDANHTPILSPDGRWLAVVRQSPNADASIVITDLLLPNIAPIEISAGSRGDSIGEIFFAPDSSLVYYVAGGNNGNNNSIFSLEPNVSEDVRIRRGRYSQGVMSPDGNQIALMNWQIIDDDVPPFIELVILDVNTTAETSIFKGLEIDEATGELGTQQFAYPLAWR